MEAIAYIQSNGLIKFVEKLRPWWMFWLKHVKLTTQYLKAARFTTANEQEEVINALYEYAKKEGGQITRLHDNTLLSSGKSLSYHRYFVVFHYAGLFNREKYLSWWDEKKDDDGLIEVSDRHYTYDIDDAHFFATPTQGTIHKDAYGNDFLKEVYLYDKL